MWNNVGPKKVSEKFDLQKSVGFGLVKSLRFSLEKFCLIKRIRFVSSWIRYHSASDIFEMQKGKSIEIQNTKIQSYKKKKSTNVDREW